MSRDRDGYDAYNACMLCPNHCGVDRHISARGLCHESSQVRVAWSGLHRGEEPPVTGEHGSGMIFFSGCPLHCQFCQNHQIAGCNPTFSSYGMPVSVDELSSMMLALQDMGATNINMVTGTHFIPSIASALDLAHSRGMTLPVVWNSSGFESQEGLDIIDPYVDLHLVDLKTMDGLVSSRFCGGPQYARHIIPVLEYLKSRYPSTYVDEKGVLRGMLVRHLVFPESLEASFQALRWYGQNLKNQAWLSLMVQFVPPKGDVAFPKMAEAEYDSLIALLDELGIEDGFVQDLGDEDTWIPDFHRDNPFPDGFAQPTPYFLALRQKKNG